MRVSNTNESNRDGLQNIMFWNLNVSINQYFCYRVFLVRDSRSNPGSYVITYKCGCKVIHAQVNPFLDPLRDRPVFSIDSGATKFYDLLQLVEFYQLNAGCLPTRLTHYVTFLLTDETSIDKSDTSHKAASLTSGDSNWVTAFFIIIIDVYQIFIMLKKIIIFNFWFRFVTAVVISNLTCSFRVWLLILNFYWDNSA